MEAMDARFFHRLQVTHRLNELLLKTVALSPPSASSQPYVGTERSRTPASSRCHPPSYALPPSSSSSSSLDRRHHRDVMFYGGGICKLSQLEYRLPRHRFPIQSGSGSGQMFFALDFLAPGVGGRPVFPERLREGVHMGMYAVGDEMRGCYRSPITVQDPGKTKGGLYKTPITYV